MCKVEYYAPPSHIDLSNIKIRGGDYDSKGLSAETNKPDITGDAIKHYKKLAYNLPAIAFCVDKNMLKKLQLNFVLQEFIQNLYMAHLNQVKEKLKLMDSVTEG